MYFNHINIDKYPISPWKTNTLPTESKDKPKKGGRLSVNTTKFWMIWRWSMHSCFDIFYCINLWRIQVMIFIFISSHSSLLAKGFWFAPLLTNIHGDQIPLASEDASHLAFRFLLFSFKFPPCLSQRRKKKPQTLSQFPYHQLLQLIFSYKLQIHALEANGKKTPH